MCKILLKHMPNVDTGKYPVILSNKSNYLGKDKISLHFMNALSNFFKNI